MAKNMIIYHGSENIIEHPRFGYGKSTNDYGLGFYCTEHPDLAKEWACNATHGGYANKYSLDTDGLKLLNLNSKTYCIIHWISVLLRNRIFTFDTGLAEKAGQYILQNFPVDTAGYDIMEGYRADDSYFTYARDFLHNAISERKLARAMKPGNSCNQIVLISQKAFSHLSFLGYEEAPQDIYFPLRKNRDESARIAYFSDEQCGFGQDDVYMIDIIRGGIKPNDPRLQ